MKKNTSSKIIEKAMGDALAITGGWCKLREVENNKLAVTISLPERYADTEMEVAIHTLEYLIIIAGGSPNIIKEEMRVKGKRINCEMLMEVEAESFFEKDNFISRMEKSPNILIKNDPEQYMVNRIMSTCGLLEYKCTQKYKFTIKDVMSSYVSILAQEYGVNVNNVNLYEDDDNILIILSLPLGSDGDNEYISKIVKKLYWLFDYKYKIDTKESNIYSDHTEHVIIVKGTFGCVLNYAERAMFWRINDIETQEMSMYDIAILIDTILHLDGDVEVHDKMIKINKSCSVISLITLLYSMNEENEWSNYITHTGDGVELYINDTSELSSNMRLSYISMTIS